MLDEMQPGQFQLWQRYWILEPFGQEWLRSSLVCNEVSRFHNTLLHYLSKPGAQIPDAQPWWFLPTGKRASVEPWGDVAAREETHDERMKRAEAEQDMLRARFGV